MMILSSKVIALILLSAATVFCTRYEIRGHSDIISSYDIDPEYFDESNYEKKTEQVAQRISQIIGPDFKDFLIHDYKIHGTDTAVFYAYLTLQDNASTNRQDIIDRIQKTDDVLIYFLRENDFDNLKVKKFIVVRDDVTSCSNGGILLPNATCACSPYNSGAQCEKTTCKNNGIVELGRCACPPGIYSNHCESRKCIAQISSTVDFSSQSFILALNIRVSMAQDLNTIIKNIQVLLDDYKNQNVNLANYIYTTYVQSKTVYIMETRVFTDVNVFITELQSIVIVKSDDDQPHLDALVSAQSSVPTMRPKSIVYLFADTENSIDPTPSTSLSNTNESLTVQITLSWRNKIVIVLSQLPSSPIQPTGNHFDVLRRVVTATHGDLIIADKSELTEIVTHLLYYFIGGQNTFVQYYNNQTKSIPILSDADTSVTNVLLTCETGVQLPNVQDKNGNVLKPMSAGSRYALYRTQKSVSDSISIVGDGIPTHNTRVWFFATDDVLISYSNDDTVDNGHAHTFSAFNQRPTLYSSFAGTTSLTVSRLDPYTSKIVQPSAASKSRSSADCVFQYQFDVVPSCTPGPYVHNVQITTASGTFYRVSPGYCVVPDYKTPAAWSCLNNGTRTGVSTCKCDGTYFNGQHCEIPICQNGGTVDNFPNGGGHGQCICPFGVNGRFCEITTCSNTSSDTFESFNRTFALVIENSLAASQALSGLTNGLQLMLKNGNSTDFEEFLLTTFKNKQSGGTVGPQVVTERFSNAQSFINGTTSDKIGYSYSPEGPPAIIPALTTTLSSMTYDKSSIFVFTDLTESSLDFSSIIQTIVDRQIEISIVIIPPYGQIEMCSNSASYEDYDILAKQTGGNFINLCQPYTQLSGDPVTNFIASYGSTHHHTEVVSYWSVPDCSNFVSIPFTLSGRTNDAYVVVYSPTIQNFSAQIVDQATSTQQALVADSHSIPFFASYNISIAASSSLSYTIKVQADKKEQCFVRVTERSQFSAYIGFSPDPSVDRYSKNLIYATHQTPVIHLSSTLQSDPTIIVTLTDNSNNLAYSAKSNKRTSGCKYEYILDRSLVCNSPGDTFTLLATISTNEVTIMRTQRAFCADLNTCLNGGISLGGSCQCLPGYGLAHCELPQCQNGGNVVDFKCQCGPRYDGDLCQYIKCDDWNFVETHDPRAARFQQITFIVEVGTKSMTLPNVYLQKNIDQFVDNTEDLLYPKQYTLITFDDTNVNVIVSSAHRDVFVNAFQKAMTVGSKTPTNVRSLAALVKTYGTTLDLPGVVYLFTSIAPSREFVTDANRQRVGVQVNLIYLGSDPAQLIPSNISPYLVSPARQSNGRIIPINSLLTPQILTALPISINENQLILDDGAKDCSQSVKFSFPVGSLASSLAIDVSGAGVSLTVTDENARNVDLTNSNTFTDNNFLIRTIALANHNAGTWTASVKGSGNCYIQVRSVTRLQVIPGFTNSLTQDFTSPVPRVGAGNQKQSLVSFRIIDSYNSNSANHGSTVDSVESYSTDLESPWSTNTFIGNTTVLKRDTLVCASQFITDFITWTSTYEKFIVRGKDGNGSPYQRTFFYSATSQSSDCLNGAGIDDYGFCQCNSNYYGSLCQFRRCQNGGISAYGLCDCPSGYYGDFCEKYIPVPGF